MGKKETGNLGEMATSLYLKDLGWRILGANVRVPGGEIDIIAREAKTGVLVFVEVKTKSGDSRPGFKPEDLYRWKKVKTTRRSCQWYAGKFPKLLFRLGWRIDLVTVQVHQSPLTDYKKDCTISHYKNAV
ncbi:MAG: hypothetical protein COU10_02535 [Candidatus Harrisonbacteria bacterium CG10_big_fil_rev_8_21_14_0_10_45_28]|uniref:UPF0102 protein COU10_02535 n=1 Tax=Candidatus Harrisonbacteria bacterium CG10_big_fil_rev_8_21_14_0_10_45_28 TaxID=1974586 RepID=A0A2H0UPV7_9BACT|nr:MAG: hypothetical protein COU10_02535 [Candidatus Harrisonbacteria bacterium CG10_big_fil_rev_8_21_14_0_10_45_28]